MADSTRVPLNLRPKVIEKPWGHEEIFEVNPNYVVKKLFVNAGHRLSMQYHEVKHETLIALEGRVWLRLGEPGKKESRIVSAIQLHPGHVEVIEACTVHQIEARTDSIILECSTPELKDVVRLKDDYGRANLENK